MNLRDFIALHRPALEADPVRHNLMLGLLARAEHHPDIRYWSLGEAGQCAIRTGAQSPLLLADLTRDGSRRLADETDGAYRGVIGPDETATAFAEHAAARGIAFGGVIRQEIQVLPGTPRPMAVAGDVRPLGADDAELLVTWMTAFQAEAVPFEPPPPREALIKAADGDSYTLWIEGGEPVAMAGIVRRAATIGAIGGVYTPPAFRNRGYAGAVTAAVALRLRAEGRVPCLYTDLSNPASNKAYARIGFVRHCGSMLVLRA